MFILSLGVAKMDSTLPPAAYALLSGLNASIVGVISLATTELSRKAATDDITRLIIFGTASAGMLYSSLWYFPTLMALSGLTTLFHDLSLMPQLLRLLKAKKSPSPETSSGSESGHDSPSLEAGITTNNSIPQSHPHDPAEATPLLPRPPPSPPSLRIPVSLSAGLTTILLLLLSLLALILLRALLPSPAPRLLTLFTDMSLAGTLIFGGGPVVIPLLREYVVAEGWVSQRDFLIGLALIQAFPGPNFNIAVFLGSLTAKNAGYHPAVGAVLAWVGIFAPGMVLVYGTMAVWSGIRGRKGVRAVLRGVNAGAVGLIYTVLYRIWEVGFLDGKSQGRSLGDDPWWLIVAAANYVFGRWYRVSPPVTIIAGALMGLIRYQVVSA